MLKILQSTKQFSKKINNVYLNKQILNTWNNRYSSSFLGNLLLNKPDDGFSKYDRGGKSDAKKDGATTESTDSNKNNTKNTNSTSNNFKSEQKTGGSGGSGGKKPNGNGFNSSYLGPYWWMIPASALVLVTILSDIREGREISWQDFQTQLLEGGHVDRIIVTNKNIARFNYYCSGSNVYFNPL